MASLPLCSAGITVLPDASVIRALLVPATCDCSAISAGEHQPRYKRIGAAWAGE
ncbi:MAG: hypothetical protein IRZ31_05725 [Thermogemmatispora sp.]|uniref:hypothetical protein n=1 Tax=Thermogemmatispora sp. TaxID=1968838 RepID=UPI002611948B|nr:hypothetical protein [Thermogemmatispora sp.]MBX5456383.1 hypothetical protein [Thermogemmatispora sp.]